MMRLRPVRPRRSSRRVVPIGEGLKKKIQKNKVKRVSEDNKGKKKSVRKGKRMREKHAK